MQLRLSRGGLYQPQLYRAALPPTRCITENDQRCYFIFAVFPQSWLVHNCPLLRKTQAAELWDKHREWYSWYWDTLTFYLHTLCTSTCCVSAFFSVCRSCSCYSNLIIKRIQNDRDRMSDHRWYGMNPGTAYYFSSETPSRKKNCRILRIFSRVCTAECCILLLHVCSVSYCQMSSLFFTVCLLQQVFPEAQNMKRRENHLSGVWGMISILYVLDTFFKSFVNT